MNEPYTNNNTYFFSIIYQIRLELNKATTSILKFRLRINNNFSSDAIKTDDQQYKNIIYIYWINSQHLYEINLTQTWLFWIWNLYNYEVIAVIKTGNSTLKIFKNQSKTSYNTMRWLICLKFDCQYNKSNSSYSSRECLLFSWTQMICFWSKHNKSRVFSRNIQ